MTSQVDVQLSFDRCSTNGTLFAPDRRTKTIKAISAEADMTAGLQRDLALALHADRTVRSKVRGSCSLGPLEVCVARIWICNGHKLITIVEESTDCNQGAERKRKYDGWSTVCRTWKLRQKMLDKSLG